MSDALCLLNNRLAHRNSTTASLLAEAFVEQCRSFVYKGELYLYNNSHYIKQNKTSMLSELQWVIPSEILSKCSVQVQKSAIDLIYAKSEVIATLPVYKDLLNVANGVYCFSDGSLKPHSPDYKFNYIINIAYNPEAKSDKFQAFMKRTFEKRSLIEHVQETCGYLISGHPPLKEFLLLKGASNASKSVLTSIIRNIVGNQNVNSVNLKELSNEYYLATMCSKKLNICSDIGSTALRDLSVIKQLTSNDDSIQIRQIREATQLVTERPKLVFASNHYPALVSDVEDLEAFFNRVHIIPFENVVPKSEQIEGYSDILFNEESEGILLYFIEGYKRFTANGYKFTESKKVVKAQNEYRNSYQLPSDFVSKCLKFVPDKKVFTQDLTEHLKWYCEWEGVKYQPEFIHQVRYLVIKKGVANKKIRIRDKCKQGFEGIKLCDPPDYNLYP